ncbi:Os07g0482566 [Oryza sativa Japonica Group]|uniref:Os07g0482566 protein n=1 Tax=Oryza sativa subsp. japonica TaxID=39947 RepID=A0A0P0X6E6_ORYSJ|nr:hypothetical protein EE612_039238 [Oryza sativa]BAT01496.1 Os07g0482566 [Oryza sativa Japonica Group]
MVQRGLPTVVVHSQVRHLLLRLLRLRISVVAGGREVDEEGDHLGVPGGRGAVQGRVTIAVGRVQEVLLPVVDQPGAVAELVAVPALRDHVQQGAPSAVTPSSGGGAAAGSEEVTGSINITSSRSRSRRSTPGRRDDVHDDDDSL